MLHIYLYYIVQIKIGVQFYRIFSFNTGSYLVGTEPLKIPSTLKSSSLRTWFRSLTKGVQYL